MSLTLALLSIVFYIAWNIGANGTANAMGVVVGSGILSFRQAVLTIAIFTILGAYLRGEKVMETVGRGIVPVMTPEMVAIIFISAGIWVTIATLRGLPVSVTQTIIGNVVGVALALGLQVKWDVFGKIVLTWVISPILAGGIAFLLFIVYSRTFRRIKSLRKLEILYKWVAIMGSSYMAFNFGTNEVANTVGPLVGAGIMGPREAGIFGAIGVAIGTLTFSYAVMYTVGKKITALGPVSAFSAQFGSAISVSLANYFGIPVSSGQAIVGGVVGAGLAAGEEVRRDVISKVVLGWIVTPLTGIILSYGTTKLFLTVGMIG
ncbi:inorganic phosphate transporter [Pyrococcus abyssi]|uniref:PitA-1 phosphate permease n=1 Tax=Pyrococcus abyssi (strain GE5 / Orsay) TaxID=272844 RepID=Q9UZR2_PYRAB|nr:inorganic phosphate transporter [Pyrococcus abyssi]CAB49994.1 pitA-1 phosphate permease [Pyrococcus abyssi GE5]CCE70494.1 TPA: sodium-dependent phosphate transporter [Pyrococcus abyssi GE5]